MASISIIATLTDIGRHRIADSTISGRGFQIVKFVVGQGGHDPADDEIPLTPSPGVSTLPGQTFGPKDLVMLNPPYTGILVTPFCPQFTAVLDFTEANGPLSNIGLIGRIISSPIPGDPLLNTEFLYAIGNRPKITKTDADQLQINITLQT